MKSVDTYEVLIVDDQKSMRELAMLYLFRIGFRRIREAENGAAARQALVQKPFDLIMLDWNLGDVTGLEVLRFLRANGANKATPVLIATGENKLSTVQTAMMAGANNYITKPFHQSELKSRIERAMQVKLPDAPAQPPAAPAPPSAPPHPPASAIPASGGGTR
jgi:two-component system chemotaxis response regulator CheY